MEGVPRVELKESIAEQPDLLAAYADKEVTIFGITGTFKDLAGMCPIDLSDPRVTLEAKNEFVIKVGNEAGMEVAPEHEALFVKVTEKHGLERNFTVATPEKTAKIELKSEQPKSAVNEQTTPKLSELHRKQSERLVQADEANSMGTVEVMARQTIERDAAVRFARAATEANSRILQPAEQQKAQQGQPAADVTPKIVATEMEGTTAVHDIPHATPAELSHFDNSTDDAEASPEKLPLTPIILPPPEQAQIADRILEEITWDDITEKDPAELCDNFAEALITFTELSAATPEHPEPPDINSSTEVEPGSAPLIALAVAERLAALDVIEQEVAAPILQDIAEVVRDIHLLEETQTAKPETLETAQAELEELCTALFETIGHKYQPEDVKQFARMLLRPEFRLTPAPEPEALDLEHMGTREIKRRLKQFADDLADVEHQLEQLLGKFALSYTTIPPAHV